MEKSNGAVEMAAQKDAVQKNLQFVGFMLGKEEYAFDIQAVQQIVKHMPITRVPKAPFYYKGMFNLRGSVLPVVDSHLRFGLPQEEATEASRIIILRHEDISMGFTVDRVTEVVTLGPDQIEKSQPVDGIDNQFVKGIGKLGARLLILLDLPIVLGIAN
ncbi:MAG: chemotaxis protein CheW [Peptococcaceae bacterium]|jgi:purine-binding chemotaxis protein CheW|nr:chemotaxis protein CheW [Peptococcaceae bacterium]